MVALHPNLGFGFLTPELIPHIPYRCKGCRDPGIFTADVAFHFGLGTSCSFRMSQHSTRPSEKFITLKLSQLGVTWSRSSSVCGLWHVYSIVLPRVWGHFMCLGTCYICVHTQPQYALLAVVWASGLMLWSIPYVCAWAVAGACVMLQVLVDLFFAGAQGLYGSTHWARTRSSQRSRRHYLGGIGVKATFWRTMGCLCIKLWGSVGYSLDC